MRKRNIEGRSCNHCCSGKPIRITHFERVFVALVMQHAKRMRPALRYFSTLSQKRRDFRKN
jgi:hypothetical protein